MLGKAFLSIISIIAILEKNVAEFSLPLILLFTFKNYHIPVLK